MTYLVRFKILRILITVGWIWLSPCVSSKPTHHDLIHYGQFHFFKRLLQLHGAQPYSVRDYHMVMHMNETTQAELLSDLGRHENIFDGKTLKWYGTFDLQAKLNGQRLQLHHAASESNPFGYFILDTSFKGEAVQAFSKQALNDHTWYQLHDIDAPMAKLFDDLNVKIDPNHALATIVSQLFITPYANESITTFYRNLRAFMLIHSLITVTESFTGRFQHTNASINQRHNARWLTFLYNPNHHYQVTLYAQDGASLTFHEFKLERIPHKTCHIHLQQTTRIPGAPPTETAISLPCMLTQ
jgi:hypothetical protein